MKDELIAIAQELIGMYGFSLLEDPERLGQLLEDKCRHRRREIFILSFALRDISRGGSLPTAAEFQADREKTTARFCENLGFSHESASWAVDAISEIIGSGEDLPSTSGYIEARRGFLKNVGNGIAKRPRSAPVRKKALRNGLLLLGIILLFFVVFVRLAGSRFPGEDEHRLLFLAHLSGIDAASGHVRLKAAQLAADQINAQGGVKGRFVHIQGRDLPRDPDDAAKAVDGLLKDKKILGMISACDDAVNRAIARLADGNELPLIATESSALAVTMATAERPWLYAFRTNYDNAYKGKVLSYFLLQGLGRKQAFLLVDSDNPGAQEIRSSFVDSYRMFGGSVAGESAYSKKTGLDSPVVAELLAHPAPAVVLVCADKDMAEMVSLLRRAGYKGTILGEGDEAFVGSSGAAFWENSWWIVPVSQRDSQLLSFHTSYRDKYNEPIARGDFAGAVLAYDSILWMADALYRAPGFQSEALRHALLSTKNLPLTHATFSIDPRTHAPWNKAVALLYCGEDGVKFQKRFRPQ